MLSKFDTTVPIPHISFITVLVSKTDFKKGKNSTFSNTSSNHDLSTCPLNNWNYKSSFVKYKARYRFFQLPIKFDEKFTTLKEIGCMSR